MSKMDEAAKAKAELAHAQAWLDMIGARYEGGGGGVGSLRAVTFSADVYFQRTHGSKNYHDAPDGMKRAMAEVIRRRFAELAAEALADLEVARKATALEVVAEHAALMREAGIEVPGGAS